MRIKMLFCLSIAIACSSSSFSQLAATWVLTSNKSGITSGAQATSVNINDVVPGEHFTATATHNTDGLRCTQNVGNWPSTPTDSFHVDFPFSPNGNYDVTITGVTLTAKTSGSSGANVLGLAVQTNGTGAFTSFGSPQNANSGGTSNLSFSNLSQVLSSGNTYTIRMYIYAAGNSTTKSRSIYIKNVVFTASAVLPLHLLSFNGNVIGDSKSSIALNWMTNNEVNSSHFEIESSENGIEFKRVGLVNANNQSGIQQYSFIHTLNSIEKANKNIFFRLVIVEKDGKKAFSKILFIAIKSDKNVSVFPNPAKGFVNIFTNGEKLTICNLLGKKVIQQSTSYGLQKIDISNLKTGLHFILLNDKCAGNFFVE